MIDMRVLGVDPGLNTTGYGVVEVRGDQLELCEAGVVRSRAASPLEERLHDIFVGVAEVVASLAPEVMSLEQLYSHYQRPTTAILMGHARGAICLAAAQAQIPVEHYAATQIKKTLTGNGRAPKWQIQLAIQRELALHSTPEPADVADALAIALCHVYLARTKLHDH